MYKYIFAHIQFKNFLFKQNYLGNILYYILQPQITETFYYTVSKENNAGNESASFCNLL